MNATYKGFSAQEGLALGRSQLIKDTQARTSLQAHEEFRQVASPVEVEVE